MRWIARRRQRELHRKLHRKLLSARAAAEAVAKQGHAENGGYYFARSEDVLAEAKRRLLTLGINWVPQVVDEELRFGKKGCIAKVVIEYQVIDTVGGGELTLRWSGTGFDSPGDKAIFKATTGTEKYFLAKLLGIPFGTDPEAEQQDSSTLLEIPPEDGADEADRVREDQDRAAEAPQVPPRHLKPLPESDLPEPDWSGLRAEEVPADV